MSLELYSLLTLETPWEKNLSLTYMALVITGTGILKVPRSTCTCLHTLHKHTDAVMHAPTEWTSLSYTMRLWC